MSSTCSQSAKNLQYGSGFIQKTSLRPEKDLSTDRMVLHLRVKVNFTAIIQLTEILCCVTLLPTARSCAAQNNMLPSLDAVDTPVLVAT